MTFSGQQAGSYILLERIGMGGMAEVFRAASRGVEGFERPVAIKRILPNLAADEEFVKMFVDEAKIAVQLQHPNIVEIFDLAREDDELFIAMEYVHGKDLRAILDKVQGPEGRRGRIPVEIAVHVTARVCDALQHAHFAHSPSGQRLGIIHRDISPQNVIVSYDGEVKVTDFGLAKAAGRAVQTQAGVVKGKLAYMSPEQLRGQAIDQRSDVYGVGILLWEMLTGVRLFLGKNDQETLRRVYNAQVPTPRSVRPELHPELEAIVLRALARDVADRYASAEEMQEELTSYLYGVGPATSTPGVSAYMRQLYPNADPVPAPSSHPPVATRGGRASLAAPDAARTARPRRDAQTTNAPPRRRDGSSQLRPDPIESLREPSPRAPFSLDDLEDLAEDGAAAGPPPRRVTRAIKPQADDSSELVRTVLQRAIASTTAQTRPPPPRVEPSLTDFEEPTNRGYQAARAQPAPTATAAPAKEPSRSGPQGPVQVFRRPSGSLSAPRVPSIESLIEEALAEENEPPHATHPQAQAYVGPEPRSDTAPQLETDEFEEHPTMVGNQDELGEASWDSDVTSPSHRRR